MQNQTKYKTSPQGEKKWKNMNRLLTIVLPAALSLVPTSAQERMNVVLTDKTVQSFDISRVEQVAFENKEAVRVQVGNAEGITSGAATVSARLIAETSGLDGITCGFFYGTTPSPQLQAQAELQQTTDGGSAFSANLSGLEPSTTYYFRPYIIYNNV